MDYLMNIWSQFYTWATSQSIYLQVLLVIVLFLVVVVLTGAIIRLIEAISPGSKKENKKPE